MRTFCKVSASGKVVLHMLARSCTDRQLTTLNDDVRDSLGWHQQMNHFVAGCRAE